MHLAEVYAVRTEQCKGYLKVLARSFGIAFPALVARLMADAEATEGTNPNIQKPRTNTLIRISLK